MKEMVRNRTSVSLATAHAMPKQIEKDKKYTSKRNARKRT
jgi:hypothetical protein